MRAFVILFAAGMITVGGWIHAMAEEKPKADPKPSSQEEKLFKSLDKDGDGKLSKDEFIAKVKDKPAAKARQEAVFVRCDKDKDGFVTLEEYLAVMKKAKKLD